MAETMEKSRDVAKVLEDTKQANVSLIDALRQYRERRREYDRQRGAHERKDGYTLKRTVGREYRA